MTYSALPSYDELNLLLSKTTLKLNASQVHGVICGLLCGQKQAVDGWEKWIIGSGKSKKIQNMLKGVYDQSAIQLEEFLFQFQLILPDDSENLSLRAEALTLWSQGFLTGLKLTGEPITGREVSEVTEAINDMIEIAQMDYDEMIASEENEAAYAELVEYVRIAIMLIYEELQEKNNQNTVVSQQLH